MIALTIAGVVSFLLLAGAWIVYPRWVSRRADQLPVTTEAVSTNGPVSVIIATREPPDVVRARVDNIRQSNIPGDSLEVIVSVDHTARDSAEALRKALVDAAVVVIGDAPGGKATALNAGVRAASHEFLVFADSAQRFDRATIPVLISTLEQTEFEVVTGHLAAIDGDSVTEKYWQREMDMRKGQAAKHSIICVMGCAYAMKKQNWVQMPTGMICDDLWVTYSHVLRDLRVGIAPDANVYDPREFTREQEYYRRLRTMTGLLQFISHMPGVLVPGRNRIFLDFMLHKAMRLVTPGLALIVVLAAVANLLAIKLGPTLMTVGIGVALGLLLLKYRLRVARMVTDLAFAMRLALLPMHAFYFALRRQWNVWRPAN